MEWKEEYATGIDEIDRQHKTLFDNTADFREVVTEGFGENSYQGFLEFIMAYAEAHFSFEEECMLASQCPATACNKAEHRLFLEYFRKEEEAYRQHGYNPRRTLELLDFIENWLDSHICRIDSQLRETTN